MVFPGKVGAVIPAAGSGKRFGEKKQFKQLGRRPLLYKTLKPFLDCDLVREVAVVVPEEDVVQIHREIKSISSATNLFVVAGGNLRQNSVQSGILALSEDCSLICIHDCARPFVTEEMIISTSNGCEDTDGCIIAEPSIDTVKKIQNGFVEKTLDRKYIWLAQTPQTFHRDILIKALENAQNNEIIATDESSLVERIGGKVKVIEGLPGNKKITNQLDWKILEAGIID